MRSSDNNIILDIIIEFINVNKRFKTGIHQDIMECEFNGEKILLKDCHYLLGQILRNYIIPDKNWYVSENALGLWKKLSGDSIWDYCYTKPVRCINEETIEEIGLYKGNEKNPYKFIDLKKGDIFKFNDIFHDEHLIDIKTIMKELNSLEKPDAVSVKKILDEIRIARILKKEDKDIPQKNGRGMDILKIFDMYEKTGIKLIKKEGMIK